MPPRSHGQAGQAGGKFRSQGIYAEEDYRARRMAEGVALPAGDRAAFEQLLQQALAVKDAIGSPLTLQNQIMRRRAAWLLEQSSDLF